MRFLIDADLPRTIAPCSPPTDMSQ